MNATRKTQRGLSATTPQALHARRAQGGVYAAILVALLVALSAQLGCTGRGEASPCPAELLAFSDPISTVLHLVQTETGQDLRLDEAFHFGPYPPLPHEEEGACSAAYLRWHTEEARDVIDRHRGDGEDSHMLRLSGVHGAIPDAWLVRELAYLYADLAVDRPGNTLPSFRYLEVRHSVDVLTRERNAEAAQRELVDATTNGENDTTLVVRIYMDLECNANYAIGEAHLRVDDGRIRARSEYTQNSVPRAELIACPDPPPRNRLWPRSESRGRCS